ncbi:MAG: thioredoxin domain-containing protein [Nanobdellota archaeon]
MKKITVITFFTMILMSMLIVSGCSSNSNTDLQQDNSNDMTGKVVITKDGSFSSQECEERNFSNKVIMLESEYCGHCKAAKPYVKDALEQQNMTGKFIDVATKEGQERLDELGLQIQYTPTFIFGCEYSVGGKTETQYYVDKINQMN